MAATDSQTLIAEAKCYGCYAPMTPAQMLKVALLLRILNVFTAMATTDSQTLLSNAKCFMCMGVSLAEALELSLLDQISQNAAGGSVAGGGGTAIGVADPEGVVTADPSTIYFASGTQTLWLKETGAGNTGWIQLI